MIRDKNEEMKQKNESRNKRNRNFQKIPLRLALEEAEDELRRDREEKQRLSELPDKIEPIDPQAVRVISTSGVSGIFKQMSDDEIRSINTVEDLMNVIVTGKVNTSHAGVFHENTGNTIIIPSENTGSINNETSEMKEVTMVSEKEVVEKADSISSIFAGILGEDAKIRKINYPENWGKEGLCVCKIEITPVGEGIEIADYVATEEPLKLPMAA